MDEINEINKTRDVLDHTNIVDVDVIWRTLGRLGKFQLKQLIVMLLSIWSCSFHVLSIVFIGFRPEYKCSEDHQNYSLSNESLKGWKTYESCKIKSHINDSGVIRTTETSCIHGYTYPIPKDRTFVTEWDLVCGRAELAELSQTLMMLGQAIGAFFLASLSDRFGRKPVNIGCHIVLFLICLGTSFVPDFWSFATMRLLTGIFQQGLGLTIAIINLEMFPKEIRAYVEVMGLLFWTTGVSVLTPLAYLFKDMSWRYLQITVSCISAWSLTHWWLIDESLRWLIANGKVESAKAVLQKACRMNKKTYSEVVVASGFREWELAMKHGQTIKDIPLSEGNQNGYLDLQGSAAIGTNSLTIDDDSLDNTKKVEKSVNMKKYTFIDLLKSKRLFTTSLVMWLAWTTNSLTYYGIMLISSTLAGNRFLNFFLGSIVEYPAAFMEYASFNRFGRKPTMIYFHTVCGIALVIATVLTTTSGDSGLFLTFATVFTLIGKMAITGSFSTLFLYTPELYPTNMRNVGIGLSSTAARAGAMLAPFSRNLAEAVDWAPGLIYGILCIIVSILALWIPETNKHELPQTLEECEIWYRNNRFRLPFARERRENEEATRQLAPSS